MGVLIVKNDGKIRKDLSMFRALINEGDIELLMQINELRLPPNSRRVTYEITPDGNIIMVKTEG